MAAFFQILLISFSLAMDSFSVSIAGGLKSQTGRISHALRVALFFGGFQALMPIFGWVIGEVLSELIASFIPWIASVILSVVGIKMIKEALDGEEQGKKDILKTKTLILLSIATSIDALVVGITLSLLKIPFFVSIGIIGIVTFILSFLGFLFGKKLGVLLGKKVEVLGGIILIIIGLKILIEHLNS